MMVDAKMKILKWLFGTKDKPPVFPAKKPRHQVRDEQIKNTPAITDTMLKPVKLVPISTKVETDSSGSDDK